MLVFTTRILDKQGAVGFSFHNNGFTFDNNMLTSPYLVRARALTGFVDLVSSHGANPENLLIDAGIPPAMVDTPDAAFPLQAFAQLMAGAAEYLQMPDFSLRMAACQDVMVLGAIALIGLNSATVEDALRRVSKNMPYHSPALQAKLDRYDQWGCIRLTHDVVLTQAQKRQLTEHTFLNTINLLRSFAQLPGRDWTIHFDHSPGFSEQQYEQLYGCKVMFNQTADELLFPAKVLDMHMPSANPELCSAGERYVRSLIRNHPLDLERQVEDLIERQLGAGRCTLPVIAEQLDMPAYSLQRRLANLNACFEDIIDTLRRRRAEEMLSLTALPLTRIADCLGYSSQTSFTRSCHRWFGESPQALRARLGKL